MPWYFSRRSFSRLKSSAWARGWRISRARSLYVSVEDYVALRVRTRNAFYLYLLQFELSGCADSMWGGWVSGLGRTLDLGCFIFVCRPFVAPFAPLPKLFRPLQLLASSIWRAIIAHPSSPVQTELCRIGRNAQGRFWCGFYTKLIDLKARGMDVWTERFDHINDHFIGRRGFARQGVQD